MIFYLVARSPITRASSLLLHYRLMPPLRPRIPDPFVDLFLRLLAHLHYTHTRVVCYVMHLDTWAFLA